MRFRSEEGKKCSNLFDPNEDTESVCGCQVSYLDDDSSNLFDPNEDTERALDAIHPVSLPPFQPIRSERGY